jgi:hypothetical protein
MARVPARKQPSDHRQIRIVASALNVESTQVRQAAASARNAALCRCSLDPGGKILGVKQLKVGDVDSVPVADGRGAREGESLALLADLDPEQAEGHGGVAIKPCPHATWRTKRALGGASARTLVAAADTASPQIVRKKSGRDQEQSTTANDDNSAFSQVKATFPTRTNNGQ